jgi:HAD superfamily hydrolase (TIGR01509 family)
MVVEVSIYMIKAVLLDMDGVMVDSMPLYCEVYNEILARFDKNIPLDEFAAICAGLPFLKIMESQGVTDESEALLKEKSEKMKYRWAANVEPIPGIFELLELDTKFAVASGAPMDIIMLTIEELGILDKISGSSSGYDVDNPKPAPDVWVDAAERISVQPSECIIIEDGSAGVTGAKKAGMKTIGLVKDRSISLGADYHVTSLFEAKKIIEGLLK